MSVSAQVSLYPLGQAALGPAIEAVLTIFRRYALDVAPGSMSTVVSGETSAVFAALQAAFARAAGDGQVVMVVTLSNACPVPPREGERRS